LNPERVLVSEDGHFRDWRGIYSLSGLTQSEYTLISQQNDKFAKLLEIWNNKNVENNSTLTLNQLHQCLFIIDRFDVYDDTLQLMSKFRFYDYVKERH
jgi:Death domain